MGVGWGLGGWERGQRAEAVRGKAILNWISSLGAIGFIVVDKDSRFIGGVSR